MTGMMGGGWETLMGMVIIILSLWAQQTNLEDKKLFGAIVAFAILELVFSFAFV